MKAEFENQEAQEKFTWLSSVLILPYEQYEHAVHNNLGGIFRLWHFIVIVIFCDFQA